MKHFEALITTIAAQMQHNRALPTDTPRILAEHMRRLEARMSALGEYFWPPESTDLAQMKRLLAHLIIDAIETFDCVAEKECY